jgi:hypothetical protein
MPKLVEPGSAGADLFLRWLLAGGGVLLLGALLAWRLDPRKPRAWLSATLATLLAVQLLMAGAQVMAPRFSGRPLATAADTAAAGFDPGAEFFSVGMYDQTLPLQLRRTVTIVDYGDELTFGQQQEPQRAASLEQFRDRWRAAGQAYAILPNDVLVRERGLGLPMTVLAEDRRTSIVARREATAAERASPRALIDPF